MAKKLDLAAAIAGAVSELDTNREQIEYIELHKIVSDEKNFYSLNGIDELAANIELCGLQQPIRVRRCEDSYIIVSGHRRFAAVSKLHEEKSELFQDVPCIVERDEGSDALSELRLIYANSDTRTMTSADISRQAERVEELLYQLKEEGFEFPGRMRDHVAEACKVSKSKLARLKVIRDGLHPEFERQWDSGKLNERAAYALARMKMTTQSRVVEVLGQKVISGDVAEKLLENEDKISENNANQRCPNGTDCQNTKGFYIGAACQQYSWSVCDGTQCCLNCYHNGSCQGRCDRCRDKQKSEAAIANEEKKKREEADALRQKELRREVVNYAKRFLSAAEAAGLDDKETIFQRYGYEKYDVARIKKEAADDFKEGFRFYSNSYMEMNCFELAKAAGKLKCSTDYLLFRSDKMKPVSNSGTPEWRTDNPPKAGTYYAKFDIGKNACRLSEWSGWDWRFMGGVKIDAKCLGWYPLPEE